MNLIKISNKMKTSAQKYNDKMNKIFAPQITHLQNCETVAEKILSKLEMLVDIDPCGLERSQVINAISIVIVNDSNKYIKE
jgi:hypothetical protein